MKTNRDEILENCLHVFASENYERASITRLSEACGLSRMGIHHYFPNKQAVFMAVADRYVFDTHHPAVKFGGDAKTLAEFIGEYLRGVERTMNYLVKLYAGESRGGEAAPNFHYLHFLFQVRLYYPGAQQKFDELLRATHRIWLEAVRKAVRSGELREGLDTERVASMFHQIHYGLSFEMAFFQGLDIENLRRQFTTLYELVRAPEQIKNHTIV